MIYFTSDLHFHHKNIIQHSKRPFSSVETMNESLIKNWNARVSPSDAVYILGDVTLKGTKLAMESLSPLQGKKYLVKGNHDSFVEKDYFNHSIFEEIAPYMELRTDNQLYVLCHYPMEEWNGYFEDSIHLHGHIHSTPQYNENQRARGNRRYDVGVDANRYAPVSLEEIDLFFRDILPRNKKRHLRLEHLTDLNDFITK